MEIDLREVNFTPALLALVPAEFARRHCVLAIQDSPQRVVVAMADPSDLGAIEALQARLGRDVEICVAEGHQLNEFIRRFHGLEGAQ